MAFFLRKLFEFNANGFYFVIIKSVCFPQFFFFNLFFFRVSFVFREELMASRMRIKALEEELVDTENEIKIAQVSYC